ncbi:transport protein particle component [Ascobolus immersus RN42]|uniref:Transport protein particle component n=1 Tax=Ascobolus immersus RN42 TaxID=1160509 RepID=A0A3N4ICJ3_ASCIM|nr:transport protein particle component [Ascobolus immersus RN42]
MSFDAPLPPYSTTPSAAHLSSTLYDLLLIELPPLCTSLSPDPSDLEAVYHRLSSIGHRVGLGLSEKFSRDRPRMVDTLEVIKFVCKELWGICWGKMVDGLKTNHRGTYVVTDNRFKVFERMSTERGVGVVDQAQYLWFPCGIIRGALANLGIEATVHAETTEMPIAVFKIETVQAKPPPL